jgi:hypothetical protein
VVDVVTPVGQGEGGIQHADTQWCHQLPKGH